ncbi:MAG: SGNH/GDSL hydrolase family protein [Candidatus Eisenbacteria bacterium]
MALARVKRVAFYVIMFALAIAVAYVVGEFLVGKFFYSDAYVLTRMVPDSTLGWRPMSGTYWLKPPHSFKKHVISTNHLGLRNKEVEPEEEGTKRIVFLGDSMVFGEICPVEHTLPVLLESLLNKECPGDRFDVVNAGLIGAGTAQELLLVKRLTAEGIVGDLYILQVFPNDMLDNAGLSHEDLQQNPLQPVLALDDSGSLCLKYSPPYRPPNPAGAQPKTKEANNLGRHSMIAEVVRYTFQTMLQTRPGVIQALGKVGINVKCPRMPGTVSGWYNEDIVKDGIPLMRVLIREIRDEARANGADLLVVFVPSTFQVYLDTYLPLLRKTFPGSEIVEAWAKDPNRPQRVTGGICSELGIPFLDLLPTMWENHSKSGYVAGEGHLNGTGNRIAADALSDFVLQHIQR